MRNIPLNLQVIAHEAQTSNKYSALIKAIKEGSEPRSLGECHPAGEFTNDVHTLFPNNLDCLYFCQSASWLNSILKLD